MSVHSLESLAETRWDAVIAGAGPTGSVAATLLARKGLRVLLVEAARFPRPKVCGGCLSAAGVQSLRDLGLGDVISATATVALREVRLSAGRRAATITLRQGGAAVCRSAFDASLTERARESGVMFVDGAHVRADGPRSPNAGTLTATLTRAGESVRLTSGVFVAADGLSASSVAHIASIRTQVRAGSRIGIGAVVENTVGFPPAGVLRMIVDYGVYIGVVRLADGRYDIAASVSPALLRGAGGPWPAIAPVLQRAGIEPGRDAEAANWKGTPLLTRTRTPAAPGVFLLGDAAAYAEPFTGEGMTWGIASAVAASEIIAASARGSGDAGAAAWREAHRRLLAGRLRSCRMVAAMVRSPALVRAALIAGSAAPALAAWVADRFARPLPPALAGAAR
jgi:flavin-dependent dehydrogenase